MPTRIDTGAQLHHMIFGAVVAVLRDRAGLSQGSLARVGRTSQSTISRIEDGRQKVDEYVARSLDDALGNELRAHVTKVEAAVQRALAKLDCEEPNEDLVRGLVRMMMR